MAPETPSIPLISSTVTTELVILGLSASAPICPKIDTPVHFQSGAAGVPTLTAKQSPTISKTIKPVAGFEMSVKSATIGNAIPCVVLLKSKTAFSLGVVVPIPT